MFHRFGGPAYQFAGGNWQQREETFPWMRREEHRGHRGHGPRFFMQRGRRGFFGPGGPFGPKGPFGPEGPFGPNSPFGEGGARRFFGRGDVKFALLELLQERPMHGYEMMKALEERSGGFYAPSAGSIYPTLQMLEDRGLVTVAEAEGKKVYSITDAGRAFLAEHNSREEEVFEGQQWEHGPGRHGQHGPHGPHGRRGQRGFPEMQALSAEAGEVARLFAIAARSSFQDEQKLVRLRGIIERTRKELSDLIYGTTAEGHTPPTPQE